MTATPKVTRLGCEECLALLGTVSVGRLGLHLRALPSIRTVRFALDEDHIVVRVAPGSQLHQAARNAVVAFGADHCDDGARRGWSVVAQGVAQEVAEPAHVARLQSLPLVPWGDAPTGDVFLRILPSTIEGERVTW